MKYIFMALCALSWSTMAGDALLVNEDGESVIAKNVTQKGNSIHFTTLDGKKEVVKRSELFEVVLKAERAGNYQPADVRKQIVACQHVRRDFPRLRKQLQPMLDEWLRLRKQFKEMSPEIKTKMEADIETQFKEYGSGKKNAANYQKLRQSLEMIRYRDFKGAFEERISDRLVKFGNDLIESEGDVLEKQMQKTEIPLADYLTVDSMVRRFLGYYPSRVNRTTLLEIRHEAREKCLTYELKMAMTPFLRKSSTTTYLSANGRLATLYDTLGNADNAKRFDDRRTRLHKGIRGKGFDARTRALPGFPLSRADKITLAKVIKIKQLSSLDTPIEDPHAILFPTKAIRRITLKSGELKLAGIFKYAPPEKDVVVIMQPGNAIFHSKKGLRGCHWYVTLSKAQMKSVLDKQKEPVKSVTFSLMCGKTRRPLSNPVRFFVKR